MRRLALFLMLFGLAAAGWQIASFDGLGDVTVPDKPPETPPKTSPDDPTPRELLHEARRQCRKAPLDTFIAAQRLRIEAASDSATRGDALHVLAEALLERIYFRTARLGMRPGEPVFARVPRDIDRDIDAALQALAEARTLGVAHGDGYRVEGSLLANRITGTMSAMSLKRAITDAYKRALDLDGGNPRLHVALGCRKLFAPKLLGRDLEKALEHLEYACSVLPGDERPRLFASLAAYLQGDREAALAWAERGLKVNNRNIFVIAVIERLRAGERDPYARDV